MLRSLLLLTLVFSLDARCAVAQAAETKEANGDSFAGLSFGVGLSFTLDIADQKRDTEAIVDANGVVRVTKKENALARVMLDSHYFFHFKERRPSIHG